MFNPHATVEICFNNEGGPAVSRACMWRLKKLCDSSFVIVNEWDKCWDVIVYNRFFYDSMEEDKEIVNDEVFLW